MREEKEAADRQSANEVLESAMFKTSISLYELLGAQAIDAGGEDLANRMSEVFKQVNTAGDGEMTFGEMQRAVVDTNVFVQEDMLQMTFHSFDLDLNEALNLGEFTDMCKALLAVRAKKQKKK